MSVQGFLLVGWFVWGGEGTWAFHSSLLIFSIKPVFCFISHLQRFPGLLHPGFFLVLSLDSASFLSLVSRSTGPEFSFSALVRQLPTIRPLSIFQKLAASELCVDFFPELFALWDLFTISYFFSIIFVRFGQTAEINEHYAFDLPNVTISLNLFQSLYL